MTYRIQPGETTETSSTDTYYSDATTGLKSSQYSELKKKMLKSVYQNGGFWIGRYEAGSTTNRTDNEIIADDLVPTSKENQYPLRWLYCSGAQTLASRVMPSGGTYTSSLMFGLQWDLVLKYLETKGVTEEQLKGTTIGSINWGNYYDSTYYISKTGAKYSTNAGSTWNDALYYRKVTSDLIALTTGASDSFNKQNIYDIAGNLMEWTLEYSSDSSNPCVCRGGSYFYTGSGKPASDRDYNSASLLGNDCGFRVSIY